jgi:hypothetical protein
MLHKKMLIIIFAAIVLIFPIMTLISSPESFSRNENRYLTQRLDFNSRNVMSRRYMTAFDDWFADRFILREDFIILQNNLEKMQGKTEINGVFTIGDRLIMTWRGAPDEDTDTTLNIINTFAERILRRYELDSFIMLVPSAQEIYKEILPVNSQPGNQTALINYCYDRLENLTPIDAATYLSENSNRYIYYRTDHHWTSEGAYWGYFAAAQKLGFAPLSAGMFNAEHAATDFRGTLFSKTLNYRITPDTVSLYTLVNNAPQISLTINTGAEITQHSSLFMREFLDVNVKDKYAVFMGVNSPIMEIETDIGNERSLLIFKDSFAHCMIPFLANHYSRITVLDMRYLSGNIQEFVDLNEYEQVLFLYEATHFADDRNLRKLEEIR